MPCVCLRGERYTQPGFHLAREGGRPEFATFGRRPRERTTTSRRVRRGGMWFPKICQHGVAGPVEVATQRNQSTKTNRTAASVGADGEEHLPPDSNPHGSRTAECRSQTRSHAPPSVQSPATEIPGTGCTGAATETRFTDRLSVSSGHDAAWYATVKGIRTPAPEARIPGSFMRLPTMRGRAHVLTSRPVSHTVPTACAQKISGALGA